MSATSEALHLIELASARLRGGYAWDGRPPRDPAARLKLQDAAWGHEDRLLSGERLHQLAMGLPADVAVDHSGLATPAEFPPALGRIVLNLMLLAAASLPFGGTLSLAGSPADLFLRITGREAAWPAGMAACVVNDAAAIAALAPVLGKSSSEVAASDAASEVQMPLTALLAHAARIRLSFLLSPANRTAAPLLRLGGG